jgi:hypothetical protein
MLLHGTDIMLSELFSTTAFSLFVRIEDAKRFREESNPTTAAGFRNYTANLSLHSTIGV